MNKNSNIEFDEKQFKILFDERRISHSKNN